LFEFHTGQHSVITATNDRAQATEGIPGITVKPSCWDIVKCPKYYNLDKFLCRCTENEKGLQCFFKFRFVALPTF